MTPDYSDWRKWAYVAGRYRRIVETLPGMIEIRDAKGKSLEVRHCFTAIVTEAA